MKKTVCILASILTFALTGCQTQLEQSDAETNSSTTTSNSSSDLDNTSESNTVNDDTNSGQVGGKDDNEADTPCNDNSSNTDTDSDQIDDKHDPDTDTSSEDNLAGKPTLPEEIGGEVNLTGNDSSGAVTIVGQAGEHQLKSEGNRRGEIEVTHKLPIGKAELYKGDILFFHIETKSAEAELKITLVSDKTGITLEERISGSGDIYFKIDTTDEYTVVLENCSPRGVQFTIDYSIGGSI